MEHQKLAAIWENVQQLMGTGGPHYGAAVQEAIRDVGMEGLRLGLLLHTLQFEPLPISAHGLQHTIPYYATEPFEIGFQKLAEYGFMEGDTKGYTLSEKGRQALSTILGVVAEKSAIVEQSIPSDILQLLYNMLKQLNDAIDSQETVEKLCFDMQKRRVPTKVSSVLSDIEGFVGNLYGFRCDCHRHEWQQLDFDLDGPTWEALTAIWQGDANSVKSITEHRLNARPTRGFGEDVYAKSLAKLASYGWIEVEDTDKETYQLTETGKAVRDDAENETDRLFYSIWSILNEDELKQLDNLTTQLVEQLSQPVAQG